MKTTATKKEIEIAIQNCISNYSELSDSEKFLLQTGFKGGMEFFKRIIGIQRKHIPEEYDRRKKMLSSDWEQVDLMYNTGASIKEIAEHFNVCYLTIYKHFNKEFKKQMEVYGKQYNKTHKRSKEKTRVLNQNSRQYKRQLSVRGLI